VPPFSTLLPLFRDLLFLRRGPQDLPHSPTLMALLIAATLALYAALAQFFADVGLPRTAYSLLLQLALTWLALRVAEKPARFVQTASALLGAGIVLTLLVVPVLFGVGELPPAGQQFTPAQASWALVGLVFHVWDLVITGSILRHALDLKLRFGVLVAVVFYAIDMVSSSILFERAAG
jgi:hypothetical protein